MTTPRPRLAQLHQSGALDGQVPTWSTALGYWVPASPSPITIVRATTVAAGGETIIYLGTTPITSSDQVFLNGALLTPGVDYTITDGVITLTTALTAGARISIVYFTSGPAPTPGFGPRPTGFTRPVPVTRPIRRFHRRR